MRWRVERELLAEPLLVDATTAEVAATAVVGTGTGICDRGAAPALLRSYGVLEF